MQQIDIAIDDAGGTARLEYRWVGAAAPAPLIVFLHEGLGAAAMWGDWPAALCAATGCRGLVFSRWGYGRSTARPAGPDGWPPDYLETAARVHLPALFAALGIDGGATILFGHSDGATIALLYAAAFPQAVRAVVALAPHVFCEAEAKVRIARLRENWGNGKLAGHLARLHDDPQGVFDGWSRRWLSAGFARWDITQAMRNIACPVLVIQGEQDQFGTLAQVDAVTGAVMHGAAVVLADCRHVPHVEQRDATLAAASRFILAHAAYGG